MTRLLFFIFYTVFPSLTKKDGQLIAYMAINRRFKPSYFQNRVSLNIAFYRSIFYPSYFSVTKNNTKAANADITKSYLNAQKIAKDFYTEWNKLPKEERSKIRAFPKDFVVSFSDFEALYFVLKLEKGYLNNREIYKNLPHYKKPFEKHLIEHDVDNSPFLDKKAGIYLITNKITKKKYVGQSLNLLERFLQYCDYYRIYDNPTLIHKALLKFGYKNFSFSIIEYCDSNLLDSREQHYINKFKTQYNIRKSVHVDKNKDKNKEK